MKLFEILVEKQDNEEQSKTGTYVAAKFSDKSKDDLTKFIKDNNIINSVAPNKLHVTILYSRKDCNLNYNNKLDTEYQGKPEKFEVWKSQSGKNCLVLKLQSDQLSERHKFLMDKHKATYDYDQYKPHVTLSYDVGEDFDLKSLDIDKIPTLTLSTEYGEPLDLDWSEKSTEK